MQQEQDVSIEKKDNLIQENNEQTKNESIESQEQINWKKFREQREIDRKQKEQAEKIADEERKKAEAFKAALDSVLNKTSEQNPYTNELDSQTEEERIAKIVQENIEKERKRIENEHLEKEKREFPEKLASTFTDFKKVCSEENLDYFEYHHPEIAEPFKYLPDSFEKWKMIYYAVKKHVPNLSSKDDQKKIDHNFSKPQSMSVKGITSTGDNAPLQLDEKRRNDNWARMQRVMKGGR